MHVDNPEWLIRGNILSDFGIFRAHIVWKSRQIPWEQSSKRRFVKYWLPSSSSGSGKNQEIPPRFDWKLGWHKATVQIEWCYPIRIRIGSVCVNHGWAYHIRINRSLSYLRFHLRRANVWTVMYVKRRSTHTITNIIHDTMIQCYQYDDCAHSALLIQARLPFETIGIHFFLMSCRVLIFRSIRFAPVKLEHSRRTNLSRKFKVRRATVSVYI